MLRVTLLYDLCDGLTILNKMRGVSTYDLLRASTFKTKS